MPFDNRGNWYPSGGWKTPEQELQEKINIDKSRFDSMGKVILPSEKVVQHMRKSQFDAEREIFGLETPQSMETLAELYNNYRDQKVSINDLSFDTQELLTAYIIKNLELPDIYVYLTVSERDTFDVNEDKIISKQEYQKYNEDKNIRTQKNYELSLIREKQKQAELIQLENTKHDFLHFDATVFICVGFICITAIVITLIIVRTRKYNNK